MAKHQAVKTTVALVTLSEASRDAMDNRRNIISRHLQRAPLPSFMTRALWQFRWKRQRFLAFADDAGGCLIFPLAGLALSLLAIEQFPSMVDAIATFPMM